MKTTYNKAGELPVISFNRPFFKLMIDGKMIDAAVLVDVRETHTDNMSIEKTLVNTDRIYCSHHNVCDIYHSPVAAVRTGVDKLAAGHLTDFFIDRASNAYRQIVWIQSLSPFDIWKTISRPSEHASILRVVICMTSFRIGFRTSIRLITTVTLPVICRGYTRKKIREQLKERMGSG